MMVKGTPQGILIYLTLALFLASALFLTFARLRGKQQRSGGRGFWVTNMRAFGLAPTLFLWELFHGGKQRAIGVRLWGAGFVMAVASVVYRGIHTGHPPMQNLFEFFLCMAAFLWPMSQWSRWRNGLDTALQDALLGLLILFPAGFVFSEEVRRLPPALQSPLFIPHVGSYVAGYVMLARAALMTLPLFRADVGEAQVRQADAASRQTAVVGFALLTVGLLLGSLWGKICWGHYWQWDPKEMWSLATWFVYGGYFHYRLKNGLRNPRALAVLLWVGLLFVVLTLTWINVSRLFTGMHSYA